MFNVSTDEVLISMQEPGVPNIVYSECSVTVISDFGLFLDEYWQNHPELHDIPIYYASSLAKKCMAVYQTYVNAMNDKIRKAININNPFVFKHISNLKVQMLMVCLEKKK